METISKDNPLILYHASNPKNHTSIMKHGLTLNQEHSGYGDKPIHNAVYLYYYKNIDVPADMIELFGSVDVYKVSVYDEKYLIPDEDSGASNWKDSLEIMGTCAYKHSIPKEQISYIGRIKEI